MFSGAHIESMHAITDESTRNVGGPYSSTADRPKWKVAERQWIHI